MTVEVDVTAELMGGPPDPVPSVEGDAPDSVPAEPGQLTPELEAIADTGPPSRTVLLSNGELVEILPLKSRQFFKLLRIITHGSGGLMGAITFKEDPEQFVGQILGLLMFAVPEAPEPTIDFVKSMVAMPTVPGPFGKKGPVSEAGQDRARRNDEIMDLLNDPPVEDLLTIVMKVVELEREDLVGLGERLAGLMTVAKKTGQIPAA